MTTHKTGSREQWLQSRIELLAREKELTRQSDAIARERQQLPWVRVEKEYQFDTEKGPATLADLFGGRSQLMIYHFMFGTDYTAGCPSCSSIADGFNGIAVHLMNHDVAFTAVSRAPLEKLLGYRKRMGWTFPWASSGRTDFNRDFNVWFTPEEQQAGIEYNFQKEPGMRDWKLFGQDSPVDQFAKACGTDPATYIRDRPGLSTFVREGGAIYHTYSSYARGLDGVWGMYQWLDRAPRGRNEETLWWKRHDEYAR
jgi:predicted dithiol-disulfide oxidoreductase (DUF899 family)